MILFVDIFANEKVSTSWFSTEWNETKKDEKDFLSFSFYLT